MGSSVSLRGKMTMTFSSTVDREKSPSNSAEEHKGTPVTRERERERETD